MTSLLLSSFNTRISVPSPRRHRLLSQRFLANTASLVGRLSSFPWSPTEIDKNSSHLASTAKSVPCAYFSKQTVKSREKMAPLMVNGSNLKHKVTVVGSGNWYVEGVVFSSTAS